jgi:imidazoleglycerol phosphate dehydratase HisB
MIDSCMHNSDKTAQEARVLLRNLKREKKNVEEGINNYFIHLLHALSEHLSLNKKIACNVSINY